MDILKRYSILIATIVIVLIVGAFAGWYFYLHGQQSLIATISNGRGLGQEIVAGLPIGSAYNNVTNAIAGLFGGTETTATSTQREAPRLWQVGSAPTASITWTTSSSTIEARFIDQASGNVFEANPRTSSIVRRTNNLIPKVVEAAWTGERGVIARFIGPRGIESFSAVMVTKTATTTFGATAADALTANNPGTLEGVTLPRGIISIAPNPAQKSTAIFYLIPYNNGIAGILAQSNGTNAQRIWTSPLTGWTSSWVGDHIVLNQKPAHNTTGSAYRLSVNGIITPLASNQPGLFVRENPSTGAILYSTVGSDNVPKLFTKNAQGVLIELPFRTLADKCVWGTTSVIYCAVPDTLPEDTLPDAWYRGEVHTSDSWWQFDTNTRSVEEVYDPQSADRSLDILDPVINADGKYIAFIDGATGTAWVLRINE